MAEFTTLQSVSRPRSFIIEGNIGAGKSTFVRLMQKHLDVHTVFEPHDKWQNVGGSGENLLERFYTDSQRWAYTFQSYAFITRVVLQEEQARLYPDAIHILERSVFSDRYCFAKNSFEMGLMNALEWKLYQEWFTWLVDNYVPRPDGFIYLQTDPEICYQRLLKRGRQEEAAVAKEYLQALHKKHEDWLIAKEGIAPMLQDVPVLVLSCNNDFEHSEQELSKHVTAVQNFIDMHKKPLEYRQE